MTITMRPTVADYPGVELPDWTSEAGTATGLGISGSLLLVHGAGADRTQLRPLGAALCQEGMVAGYPSLRRHGKSPAPPWGYSVLEFAADLHRIGDVLPGDLHLIGYSVGGLISAISAVTWASSRVRSLVLIDSSFTAHPEKHEVDEWAEGSFLRWHYDYSRTLDIVPAPVLFLAAEASPAVDAAERARLSARTDGGFTFRLVPGTHTDCYTRTGDLVALIGEFYTGLDS
jgi:pimeloyl-ACP methyl ester carboxylesterase